MSLIAGALVKMPVYLSISEDWFYPRFIPLIVFSSLVAYFAIYAEMSRAWMIRLSIGLISAALVMAFLPDDSGSASILMSQIHLPLVLSALLGLAYMSADWRKPEARMRYIRYLGDTAIYTGLILVGGIILTAMTLGLFGVIGISIEDWYLDYIVVLGLVASPIVATYLYDAVLNRQSALATLIANLFAPLFLVTVVAYLLAMLYAQKSPYSDRDFLIVFNGLLLIVWSITVFSIAGRSFAPPSKLRDLVNISLVSTTLAINAIALSAILFRLAEYGMTPNRAAVTGANILIFIHLGLIIREYVRQVFRQGQADGLVRSIARFLPIYTLWACVVVVVLPVAFWFE